MDFLPEFCRHHAPCAIWATASVASVLAAILVLLYLVFRKKDAEKGILAPEAIHVVALFAAAIGDGIEAFQHF
jgi:hypothetical protein